MKIEQMFQNNGNTPKEEDKDDYAFKLAKLMLHEVMNHTQPSKDTLDLIEGQSKNIDRLVSVLEEYVKVTKEFVEMMKEKEDL